jgi:hypothetical protein
MKFQIVGKPQFFFELSKEQLEVLTLCAASHYDGVCQSSAKQGGFIHGWNNYAQDADGKIEVSANWRGLDTCCKILENFHMLTEPQRVLCFTLAGCFRRAMIESNEQVKPWEVEVDL